MNSWFVWIAFALVAIVLGLIAYCFSLRVLRVAAAIVALVTAAYLTRYGLTHPAKAPGSLSGAFTRGTDALIRALFHLPPVQPGHHVPGPGWIGWLVIAVLLVIGYRNLRLCRSIAMPAAWTRRSLPAPGRPTVWRRQGCDRVQRIADRLVRRRQECPDRRAAP